MTVLFQQTVISKSAVTELASAENRLCFMWQMHEPFYNST